MDFQRASLPAGLLSEAAGDKDAARAWIAKAIGNAEYAQSDDYMYALARVHAHQRGDLKPAVDL